MNRTALGIRALIFSFLCMAFMDFTRGDTQTVGQSAAAGSQTNQSVRPDVSAARLSRAIAEDEK